MADFGGLTVWTHQPAKGVIMSITLMSWAFKLQIPTTHKFVLLALSDRANDEGESCYPGQKEISEKTSCSVRTVQRSLDWLEEKGFLIRTERRGEDGYRTSDNYKILHDKMSCDKMSCDNDDDLTCHPDDSHMTSTTTSHDSVSYNTSGIHHRFISEPPAREKTRAAAGQKKEIKIFSSDEIEKAARGDPGWNPEISDSDILPGGWDDLAEQGGMTASDKLFLSWRKFKDITSYPYQRKKWEGWLKNEQGYQVEDLD